MQLGSLINLIVNDFIFGWRISIGVQFMLGLILALGMLFFPRSPRLQNYAHTFVLQWTPDTQYRWLAKRYRDGEALKILSKIYKDQDRAETQLEEIKSTVSSTKEPFLQTLKYIIQWKMIQRYNDKFSNLIVKVASPF